MHVSALAEALAGSRRPDGAISLKELLRRLSGAGLDEYSRAADSLTRRASLEEDLSDDPTHPWV